MIVKSRYFRLLLLIVSVFGILGFLGCSSGHRTNTAPNREQQIEHGSYVNRIRFSHQGKHLFSKGDLDGKIIMWSPAAMQPEKVLIDQLGKYSDFEDSPVGNTFAYSMGDFIRIYNYEKGEQVGSYQGTFSSTEELLFSSDGRYLIAELSESPGTIIWCVETDDDYSSLDMYQLVGMIPGTKTLVYWIGKYLVFFDIDTVGNELRGYNIDSGKEKLKIEVAYNKK